MTLVHFQHFFRKYDYQRAKCEDPTIIYNWFVLVQNTIAKYGIHSDDIYNFDETGFRMGMIASGMVVTGSEKREKPKSVQPGSREWITVIQAITVIPRYRERYSTIVYIPYSEVFPSAKYVNLQVILLDITTIQ